MSFLTIIEGIEIRSENGHFFKEKRQLYDDRMQESSVSSAPTTQVIVICLFAHRPLCEPTWFIFHFLK